MNSKNAERVGRLEVATRSGGKMCKMNGKQLGKAIILVPIFMVLAAILTMSLLAEARPSALNKKPPFNGSIFGKRSGVVSSRGPGLGASNPTLAENYPNWSAFSQQLQQLQQQQEALTLINAAITRCLAQQRDGIQVNSETMSACDELLVLASLRDKFS